jgi:hypothetical protein
MTMRRPESTAVAGWLFDGLNAKNVIVMVVLVVTAHYAQGARIGGAEDHVQELTHRIDETQTRIDVLREDVSSKVDRDTYNADQLKLANEFTAIEASQGRIETILMEQKGH